MNQENDCKTVIIGNSSVGKSSIMKRFVEGKFEAQSQPTIGTAYMSKKVEVRGRVINFQVSMPTINFRSLIWDTAGQDSFKALQKMYYKDASVAILVYDITRKDTFSSLKEWYNELEQNTCQQKLVVALVGNKVDMNDYEAVSYQSGKSYAQEIQAEYTLTSAKDGTGIDVNFKTKFMEQDLFTRIASVLLQKEQENPELFKSNKDTSTMINLKTGKEEKKKSKCC